MKTFFKWLGVAAFLVALSFLVYSTENKQTYKLVPPVMEKKVEGDTTQIGNIEYVKIGDVNVKVELAVTPQAKQLGLGGRTSLGENEGMLFVFLMPGKYAFWMKDMKFPIDILWIRDDGEVVYIKKNVKPESYPETFKPEENVKYVLEVPAGFSEKNNLKVGAKAELNERLQ